MTKQDTPPVVLVIAGNDPSGGAGIAADIQAITACGAHPAPVISALTVQDTINAYEFEVVEPLYVKFQAQTVLNDLPVAAIKLGMLGSAEVGTAVAELLSRYPEIPVITDPVLVAAGGATLAEERLQSVYLNEILPRTTILTPNAYEIRALAREETPLATRAVRLLNYGCQYVLQKGGDEQTTDVSNTLYSRDGCQRNWVFERIAGEHHGSGCTLASSIAAFIAQRMPPEQAVDQAMQFTQRAIATGWQLGRGQNIPNRH